MQLGKAAQLRMLGAVVLRARVHRGGGSGGLAFVEPSLARAIAASAGSLPFALAYGALVFAMQFVDLNPEQGGEQLAKYLNAVRHRHVLPAFLLHLSSNWERTQRVSALQCWRLEQVGACVDAGGVRDTRGDAWR